MNTKRTVQRSPVGAVQELSSGALTGVWADTVRLLQNIFNDLPTGPFGAIIRLSGGAIVLLGVIAILSLIVTKKTEIVVQLVIFMFLFFMVSVVVYVFRPPNDVALATAQARRMRQIAPKPIHPRPDEGAA